MPPDDSRPPAYRTGPAVPLDVRIEPETKCRRCGAELTSAGKCPTGCELRRAVRTDPK